MCCSLESHCRKLQQGITADWWLCATLFGRWLPLLTALVGTQHMPYRSNKLMSWRSFLYCRRNPTTGNSLPVHLRHLAFGQFRRALRTPTCLWLHDCGAFWLFFFRRRIEISLLKVGFHYPSWRPELTGVKKCTRVLGPWTRVVETDLYLLSVHCQSWRKFALLESFLVMSIIRKIMLLHRNMKFMYFYAV